MVKRQVNQTFILAGELIFKNEFLKDIIIDRLVNKSHFIFNQLSEFNIQKEVELQDFIGVIENIVSADNPSSDYLIKMVYYFKDKNQEIKIDRYQKELFKTLNTFHNWPDYTKKFFEYYVKVIYYQVDGVK